MAARSATPPPARLEHTISATFLWGFALLAVALLVFLALVSYSPSDWPATDDMRHVNNWIGAFGAVIACGLGPFLLGRWAAFGAALIIGIWGWTLMRRLNWKRTFVLTVWVMVFALWISAFFGLAGDLWPGLRQTDAFPHSGQFGAWAAENLTFLLGQTGAVIVMLLVLIVGLGFSVAGFASWFERGVNTAIDKASDLKVPRVPFFGSRNRTDGASDQPLPNGEEAVIAPLPLTAENANGKTAKPAVDTSRFMPPRKEKASPESQLSIQIEDRTGYVFPPLDLFNPPKLGQDTGMSPEELQRHSDLLEKTLSTFGVQAKVVRVNPGPVITRFDLEPAPGVKVSRIEALADDIALALRARGLRILAPIPGVAAVGVEIANPKPAIVTFREVVESPPYQNSTSRLTMALGRTVQGDIFTTDLASLPHLLIAGTTGSGKSVCVNTIIASILLRTTPEDVQLVMIDPKKLEMAAYNELRNHHVTHRPDLSEYVVTKPDEAVKVLRSCLLEMERRYDLLAERGARHLREYNEMVKEEPGENEEKPLPYVVVVIDELADLMVTAQREVEEPIARLAQLARAVGIHLVVATQRPSVDVITGVIKANFPARIAFRVAMKVDSRTILDTNGAEMLLGQGDMLFQHPEEPAPIRLQGALLTSAEISRLISHICKQRPPREKLVLPIEPDEEMGGGGLSLDAADRDPFFLEAAKIVVRTGQGSVSILQRRLKIGYSRAARLIDQLERAGVVGPFDGSKARAVLVDEHYFDTPHET
jgi:S-DNA-T family DNA segregation ATPase FtsK/SpoIIIE